MPNYDTDLMLWNAASIHVVDIKHGLLIKRRTTELFENSSLLFVRGKSGKIQIEDTPYVLKSNCLFHVSGNSSITLDAYNSEIEYFAVAYQAELSPYVGREMLATLLQTSPFERTFGTQMMDSTLLANCLLEMTDAWKGHSPLNGMNVKLQFYAIVYALYQELSVAQATPMEVDVVEKTRQYLQTYFAQTNSVQLLADSLGVTRATLYKQFKQQMGLSPQQYVMQLRLDFACTALAEDRLSIDEIAACCGLRDKSYFSRVFKQKYGLPPGAYRKRRLMASTHRHTTVETGFQVPATGRCYTLIENFGRIHRYYGIPRRIVCLDYSAAELCAALGVSNRVVGVASAETTLMDCKAEHQSEIAAAPFLPGRSLEINVPSYKSVCDCKPDLVIGTAYSFHAQGGVADAASFEQLGIHIYALKATYTLGSTFADTYEDILNLGRILGADARATALIEAMKRQEELLLQIKPKDNPPVRVFAFDSILSDKVLTCGQSLETHLIAAAGGVNVFSDRARQFVPVSWSEVAYANPQAIIIHRFHDKSDGEQKRALLNLITEIAETDAVRHGRIYMLGIKKVFPGIDNIETTLALLQWFNQQ